MYTMMGLKIIKDEGAVMMERHAQRDLYDQEFTHDWSQHQSVDMWV